MEKKMHIAIINQETNRVENIVVPPEGATAYFIPSGFYAVETETGGIGDTYDNGTFVKPVVPEENPEQGAEE